MAHRKDRAERKRKKQSANEIVIYFSAYWEISSIESGEEKTMSSQLVILRPELGSVKNP